MPKLKLKPITDKAEDFDKVEKELREIIKREVYLPLIAVFGFKSNKLSNSKDDLLRAIQSGQITYHRGKFKGRFNATLSREFQRMGAQWDRVHGSWSIPQSKLDIETRNAIALSESAFDKAISKLLAKLEQISPAKIAEKIDVKNIFDTTLSKINKDFKENTKKIGFVPEVSEELKAELSLDYDYNVKFYVKGLIEEEVAKLRTKFRDRTFGGHRYEGAIKEIQESYGISASRAKLIARQETKLMSVKYLQIQYKSAGITEYEWRCVSGTSKHPVREDHQVLNGNIYTFDKPPVVDVRTGRRRNPGEDYNCRCMAIPILNFK